jgi:hypothetical protein
MEAVADRCIAEALSRPCTADKYRRPGLDPPQGMGPGFRLLTGHAFWRSFRTYQ